MGLWEAIFGKKEAKMYKPEKFLANDRTLNITAKHNAMLSVYEGALASVEGTVTGLKQNKNDVTISDLEGILFLPKDDGAFIEIECEGKLQGDWYFPGTIEAKSVHLTIRKPMKLNICAKITSANGFTNVQNYYLPTHLLPEKLRQLNPSELTPEEINGSHIAIDMQADRLETTRIMAHTVNITYLPFENEKNEEEE